MRLITFLLACSAIVPTAAHAVLPFSVRLESEKPGIQYSTSGFDFVGVETFDDRKPERDARFKTDFGTGGRVIGVYSGVQVLEADQYGGADGKSQYAATFDSKGYTLDLYADEKSQVNYFGLWLSALDGGNEITFSSQGKELFVFNAEDARAFIKSLPNASDYFCNPNEDFKGQNCGEPYAFLNFYAGKGVTFNKVAFAEKPMIGGYESDNHTIGQWNRQSGTIFAGEGAGAVPEPARWAMLIAGFGLVGAAMRRRTATLA